MQNFEKMNPSIFVTVGRPALGRLRVSYEFTGALGDKKDEGGGSSGTKEIDPEVEEALREAEARRQEKHRKMEEEREAMRQDIRDKVSSHGVPASYIVRPKPQPLHPSRPSSETKRSASSL